VVIALAKNLRSLLALLAVMVWFIPCGFAIRFFVLPAALVWPRKRPALISAYMKVVTWGIFALLRAGGARVRRVGSVPTEKPALVIMNHQSLLDIQQMTMMARPFVPAFVTRARYARFIPLISPSIRLLGCPIIDPARNRRDALEVIRDKARALEHGLLIFPEGHRTRDGEIQAFHTAGLRAILAARPLPVYLAVTDGFWRARRFVDVLFNIHLIDGRTEVLGPYPSPTDERVIPEFLEGMRERMVARLGEMRGRPVPSPEAQPALGRSG
jgi:1-acyl-sn-glycerol-3-phosphate acyltransferase